MSREVPTTRYFAIGFFTAAQLAEKDRALLTRAAQNAAVSEIRSAVEVVAITVFDVDTGNESVEMGMRKVGIAVQNPRLREGGVSFAVERFGTRRLQELKLSLTVHVNERTPSQLTCRPKTRRSHAHEQ